MKKGSKFVFVLVITDGERVSREMFDTKREAVNAMAAWSMRRYERTGNFNHEALATIKREQVS
jgi:hypothetical protein